MLVLSLALIVLSSELKFVHAGMLSSRVLPTESRRQGLSQVNPCPGDIVEFTCILNDATSTARWTTNDIARFTFIPAVDQVGTTRPSMDGYTASYVSETTHILMVNLSESSPEITNGTEISCIEINTGVLINSSETLIIIGLASAPSVTVHTEGFSLLAINMIRPVYGRECVDFYRATAVIGGMPLPPLQQSVTDPNQETYSFRFQGLDLCRDNLTNATAVGLTNGVEGTVSSPITNDETDRSRIITSGVAASQSFTISGVNISLTWQVVDQDIMPNGFNITCLLQESVTSCQVIGTSVTNRFALFLYDIDLEGRDISFNIGYFYEMCENSPVTATLTIRNVNSSLPQEIRDQRSVRVEFNETLFVADTVNVVFSSNCTNDETVDYRNPLMITIPDTRVNTGQCQYNIQLVDRATSTFSIGYPIIGFFDAGDLPPPSSPPHTVDAAAAGGGAAGAVVVIIIIIGGSAGGGYAIFKYTKKEGDKKNNAESGDSPTNSNLIEHETAPGGEEYALVPQKSSKPPLSSGDQPDSFYQDPNSIEHKQGPKTGDLYAVTEKKAKKGSKKGPSGDELSAVYSVPDKSKKNPGGLTYATLDMPGGSGAPQQPPLTEYATVIN